jgi:glycosyltransferase involved in cell wall biosynthesis
MADKLPSISTLITLYNHENFIATAIASATEQTCPPAEIIVIDDCSTDGSVAAVRKIVHPLVRLIEQPYNMGGTTTVRGIHACTGDYIAILNSDDCWAPTKLERQLAYMQEHAHCSVVFTRPVLIDEHGEQWPDGTHYLESTFKRENRTRVEWLRYFYFIGNAFCTSSALIRKACLDKLGVFDPRYVQLQDFDLWLRMCISGYSLHIIDEPLTYYRVARDRSNMSSITGDVTARVTYEYARILQHFWMLQSTQELATIFPDSGLGDIPEDNRLIKFYLATISRKLRDAHHQQFAADSLFEMGKDPDAITAAAERYGFSHADYCRLMAYNPVGRFANQQIRHRLAIYVLNHLSPRMISGIRRLKRRFIGKMT